MDEEQIVESGYDHMAEQYLGTKGAVDSIAQAALEHVARDVPQGGAALDLGCGAGVPITQWLAQRFVVTGVDVSAHQLQLAREHVPGAMFIRASMAAVDFPPETFDAVVAFHSIIHVPRTEHPMLVRRIHRWLRPGLGHMTLDTLGKAIFSIRVSPSIKRFDLLRQIRRAQCAHQGVL